MSNKLTRTLIESSVILLVGLAITGSLMFAFARNASANDGADKVGHVPAGFATTTQMQIAGNGVVLVRGAKITAIADSSVTAQAVWGNTTVTWTVRTDANTKYYRQNSETAVRSALAIGDYASFAGTLDTSAAAFTVNADVVRDQSLLALTTNHDSDNDQNQVVKADASWHSWFNGFSFGGLFGGKK